jgi:hypothetical protein
MRKEKKNNTEPVLTKYPEPFHSNNVISVSIQVCFKLEYDRHTSPMTTPRLPNNALDNFLHSE